MEVNIGRAHGCQHSGRSWCKVSAVPQRVLFLCTDLEVGGTPHVVRDLAIRLRGPDRTTAVACIAPWGPVAGEIERAGIRVRAMGAPNSLHLPRVVNELSRVGKSFDVIFSFLMHANFVAAVTSRLLPGVRLIQSIQTAQARPMWHWALQGLIAPAAEAIVVPSASASRAAIMRSEISPAKVRVIPNAVDMSRFAAPRTPHSTDRCRIGFIGRLDPVKRVGDLVRAIALLPCCELHVFGDGDARPGIEALITRLGVADRVTMHGTTQSAAKALLDIDTLVLPSDAEGFGIVLIEAMAAGVPVIGTDVDGIRDVVTHEKTGLLVPPRSPPLIARAIERLMNDAGLRERLCAAGKAHVQEDYGWKTILAQYDALLNNVPAS